MIKIIFTGHPDLENAIESVNKSADAYITKPFSVDNLLKTIKEHLKKQKKALKYDEEKVADFVETRVRELEENRAASYKKYSPFRIFSHLKTELTTLARESNLFFIYTQ